MTVTAIGRSLIQKIGAEKGPVTLTAGELRLLRHSFNDMHKTNLQLAGINTGMATALGRRGLVVTHETNADGTMSFSLEPSPSDDADPTTSVN